MLIKNRQNNIIGLDISDLSLKIAMLRQEKNNINIDILDRASLPIGLIEDGNIIDEKAVVSEINTLLSKQKKLVSSRVDVVASLPETKTFIKLLHIENSPNNIEDMIKLEMGKHLPIDVKDIYHDWQIIENKADHRVVLVGAAPKSIINQYISLLKASNLSISALEIESTAICRSLLLEESPKYENKKEKNYCIIDFGAKRSSLIIYSKNTIVLSLSIPISGEKITESIGETLELKKPQAEKAKIVCGLDKTKAKGIISEILSKKINELTNRIEESIDYYYNHYPKCGKIDEIILCGGGSNINQLDKIIEEKFSIKTYKGDSFIKINKSSLDSLKKSGEINYLVSNGETSGTSTYAPAYSTAIGLALRGIFIEENI